MEANSQRTPTILTSAALRPNHANRMCRSVSYLHERPATNMAVSTASPRALTLHTAFNVHRRLPHAGECFGISLGHFQQSGLTVPGGRFAIDGNGYARARHEVGGLRTRGAAARAQIDVTNLAGANLTDESLAPAEEASAPPATNIWLGVTSLESKGNGDRTAKLVAALHGVIKMVGNVRVIINHNDGPGGGKPRAGQPIEASNDLRITTTWVAGPRAKVSNEEKAARPTLYSDSMFFDYVLTSCVTLLSCLPCAFSCLHWCLYSCVYSCL